MLGGEWSNAINDCGKWLNGVNGVSGYNTLPGSAGCTFWEEYFNWNASIKADMMKYLASPETVPRPHRIADVVAIGKGSKVFDGLIDLNEGRIVKWELTEGVQPLITMEDLQIVETVVRKDAKVIEQCGMLGIPPQDMHKVYCDPWTIGYDERFGSQVRLQQALMYYRPNVDDSQYTYPLDFCP